ncbi:polya [Cystoisospora suis]|uniref:polynucleotide adenylyltransferase n=1 Tax=Cystoisospora suis TaxID=483139 RepID=A0A2C6KQ60_9APIC|nr:polya [Cystoisospora suis]
MLENSTAHLSKQFSHHTQNHESFSSSSSSSSQSSGGVSAFSQTLTYTSDSSSSSSYSTTTYHLHHYSQRDSSSSSLVPPSPSSSSSSRQLSSSARSSSASCVSTTSPAWIRAMGDSPVYVQEKEGVYPYGVTNPVNLRLPQEGDIHRSNELISVLKSLNLYETAAGTIQRERVLNELNRIILEWVIEVGIEQGLDEEEARQAGGKIFTFGSYRLGVTTPGSDIDTLCVTPRHISREAFFSVLHAKLQQDSRITKLIPVPDAYTPLLKFNFDGVEIDLLFARLPLPLIPNSWSSLDNDLILRYVDEKTARSVNGSRVADLILKLVPNKETFRVTLRFIKYWAKSRCIYSNVLGYLGGISWSILVARCCQLYPNFSPSQLIQRFFTVYSIWNWRNSPVLLCKIKDQQGIDGLSNFKVWNPKVNIQDRYHLLPIITPAFPSMNSTHNVSLSTKNVITEELALAKRIFDDWEKKRRPLTWIETLHLVMQPLDLTHYKHFLELQIFAQNETIHRKWLGWVESKVRFLVKHLERLAMMTGGGAGGNSSNISRGGGGTGEPSMTIRPFPSIFSFEEPEWRFASSMLVGLTFSQQQSTVIDLRPAASDFVDLINQWSERPQYQDQIQLRVKHLRRSQLPAYVFKKEEPRDKGESLNVATSSPSSHSSLNHEENGIHQSTPSSSWCRGVSSVSTSSSSSPTASTCTSSTLMSGGSSRRGTGRKGGGEEEEERERGSSCSSSSDDAERSHVGTKRKLGEEVEKERGGVEVGEGGEKKRMKAHDTYSSSPTNSEVGSSSFKQRGKDGDTGGGGGEEEEGRKGMIKKIGMAVHIDGGKEDEEEDTSHRA